MLDDLRQQWLEPLEQGFAAGVADAQPDDDGGGHGLAEAVREVFVLGNDNGLLLKGVEPDGGVVGVAQANVGNVLGLMAVGSEQPGQGGRQLGIDDEAHGLPGDEDGMIGFGSGVFQTGSDVVGFQIRIVFEDFSFGHSGGQQIKHVLHADAHPADAGTASTLVRVEGDAFIHAGRIDGFWRRVKSGVVYGGSSVGGFWRSTGRSLPVL